ncbi:YkvI family membrane protein [Cytobacillus sp. Hm23]
MIKSGLKWMFLILGTMIGAGYASGREIWQFFGQESGLAIIIFTLIFIISCFVIMKISYEEQSEHFLPVLQRLVGKRLSLAYDWMIILYLFTTTVVMLAGGGATLEILQIPYWIGILIFCFMLVFLFIWDLKGIVSINIFILPILIISLMVTLFLFLYKNGQSINLNLNEQSNWPSAFTFTALNILPLVAVLSAIGKEIKKVGEAWIASIGSGLLLGIISFIYNQSLLQIASEMILYEIPLFGVLKYFPYAMLIIMSFLLWSAIYTTAASGIFGLTTRFRKKIKLPFWLLALLTLITMIPFTSFGFATLVSVLYPIYGVINLYLLAAILIHPIANRYKWE